MPNTVKAIPDGYHAATPYLSVNDAAAAIEFYKKAFGATEVMRFAHEGKVGHAEIRVGPGLIMLADEFPGTGVNPPKSLNGTSVGIHLYVENVDALFRQAIAAGATEIRPLKDQFYGDRSASVRDPFGHVWNLSQHIEDVSEEEMQRRMREMTAKP